MSELLRLVLVGIAGGIGVFAVILLPAMWLQRRRFGRVRPPRLAGVAVICVYTMTLAGLTIAPAYDVAVTCRSRSGARCAWIRSTPRPSCSPCIASGRGGGRWPPASRCCRC
ncbi:hypothetical protein [Brachybacterium sp. Z12]|uniref:hypothetical protein n=1 Tax=Brachybacterium sp. Z12 TaxID=2759167 RepID=UPI00223ACD40|nr:hypothetical protein [Brachybacterium sp. Z12]